MTSSTYSEDKTPPRKRGDRAKDKDRSRNRRSRSGRGRRSKSRSRSRHRPRPKSKSSSPPLVRRIVDNRKSSGKEPKRGDEVRRRSSSDRRRSRDGDRKDRRRHHEEKSRQRRRSKSRSAEKIEKNLNVEKALRGADEVLKRVAKITGKQDGNPGPVDSKGSVHVDMASFKSWHRYSGTGKPLCERFDKTSAGGEGACGGAKRAAKGESRKGRSRSRSRGRDNRKGKEDRDGLSGKQDFQVLSPSGHQFQGGRSGPLISLGVGDSAGVSLNQRFQDLTTLAPSLTNETAYKDYLAFREKGVEKESVHSFSRLGWQPDRDRTSAGRGSGRATFHINQGRVGGRPQRGSWGSRRREENEQNVIRLFDPTSVPKGRSYFEHDEREGDGPRGRFGRGRGRGRGTGGNRSFEFDRPTSQRFPRSGPRSAVDGLWKHDKFAELEPATVTTNSPPLKRETTPPQMEVETEETEGGGQVRLEDANGDEVDEMELAGGESGIMAE